MKLIKLLDDQRQIGLVVSLPANDLALAEAAVDAGADALKVHLNVEHRASGTRFGSFDEERDRIAAIARLASDNKVALGVMPGAQTIATPDELARLEELGFEFLDCYADDLPASYLGRGKLKRMIALGPDYRLDELKGLASLGVDVIEASIIEPAGYGRPLSTADLMRYRSIAATTRLPVVVPTQRQIRAEEVPLLAWAGVAGVIIGAIVTGRDAGSLRTATAAFRQAIDHST